MSKQKKAQAAMEFLMTYGWAILVVLIAIGALSYFGVFSPGKWLPTAATIGSGFSIPAYKVNASSSGDGVNQLDQGNVYFQLRNGQGTTLTDVSINLTDTSTGKTCVFATMERFDCSGVGVPHASCTASDVNNKQMLDGATYSFSFNCSSLQQNAPAGTQFKAAIAVVYSKSGETVTHSSFGDFVGKVEDGTLPIAD
jgi:hypothetical protein